MTKTVDAAALVAQLTHAAQADAKQIEQIMAQAAEDITAILDKYADVSLPALSNGRNAVASLRMFAPMPAPPMPPMPVATAIPQ